jgi:hypothetical protein
MRLIIVCLCLCSCACLVGFSRVGFPEDPLHILGSPPAAADREAKDQSRFAKLQRAPMPETSGGPATLEGAAPSIASDEPPRIEASAAEAPTSAIPLPVPAPVSKIEPAGKIEPVHEHRSAAVRAKPRLVRLFSNAVRRRVLLIRAASPQRAPSGPGPRRVLWTVATPRVDTVPIHPNSP